jgi:hypothetical protein
MVLRTDKNYVKSYFNFLHPHIRRIRGPGREADHSHPSSAEDKNVLSCTSTPPYVFKV